MNKRRLLKLADLLEADAKNKKGVRFDLGTWAAPATDIGFMNTFKTKQTEVAVDCGTKACAVGLACISGAFKREGLSFYYKKSWIGGYHLIPKFDGSRNFNAVEKFFGISNGNAEFLFDADKYPDEMTAGAAAERFVAKRIRDFVAGKVAP